MKCSEIKNKEPYIEIEIKRHEAQRILADLEFINQAQIIERRFKPSGETLYLIKCLKKVTEVNEK